MPAFDLGRDLALERHVPSGPARTYDLARDLLAGYSKLGFQVAFEEESPPSSLGALIHDAKGTRIQANLVLSPNGVGTVLSLQLTGAIFVGGMQGMMASEGMVRSVARQKLAGFLDETFADVEPDPEPVAAAPAEASAPADAPTQSPLYGADGPPATDLERRLAVVKDLFVRGLISEDDYKAKKKSLLESL